MEGSTYTRQPDPIDSEQKEIRQEEETSLFGSQKNKVSPHNNSNDFDAHVGTAGQTFSRLKAIPIETIEKH